MLLLLVFTAILAVILYYASRPYRQKWMYPPGPVPIPLIGNLLMFRGSKNSTFVDTADIGRKWGDGRCVTLWFGLGPSIIINTFEGVQKAFVENQHDFASRPDLNAFDDFFEGTEDIIMGKYSPQWHSMKKLGAKLLRRVIDSNRLESNVTEATDKVVKVLLSTDLSQPVEVRQYTTNVVYNILAALCYGIQFDMDNPRFIELMELRTRGNEAPVSVFFLLLIPGLNRFPKLLRYYPPWRRLVEDREKELGFLQSYINEHKESFPKRRGTSEEVQDILDAMLLEQEETHKAGDDTTFLTDATAKMIVFDIFAAGTETTSATLQWFVLEMVLNPKIQEECAQQIQNAIGNGVPSLEDKQQLPLVEASILETLRLHPVAPIAVAHAPSKDVSLLFDKYPLPQNTTIIYNIHAVHRDPELFTKPEKFDPYRFIEHGKTYKPTGWIPFGVGRRVCLGETLAKNDLFLVCTGLLQKLRFKEAPGVEYTNEPEVTSGLTNLPFKYKYIIEIRNQ